MSAPPPGAVQCPSIGDKPINAKEDFPEPPETVQVCCVLVGDWPGASRRDKERCADLGAHYVECLYSMLCRYAPRNVPWRFTCFTDRRNIEGIPCKPIPSGIYSYFNKLYLFSADIWPVGTRVLYLDLDTCVVADWSPLATLPLDKVVMLRDLWAQRMPASGLMSWRVSKQTASVWNDYAPFVGRRPPYTHPRPSPSFPGVPGIPTEVRTDEHWINHYLMPDKWAAFQELLPGHFLSYKYDVTRVMRRDGTKGDRLSPVAARAAGVVYFHGRPRPHEVVAKWNPFWRSIVDAPAPTVNADGIQQNAGTSL